MAERAGFERVGAVGDPVPGVLDLVCADGVTRRVGVGDVKVGAYTADMARQDHCW